MSESCVFGAMAKFDTPEALLAAARAARAHGYARLEAYTPFPVEGLAELLGFRRDWMPLITLLGGLAGGATALGMQAYSAVWAFPYNVGGRPFFSWPSFVPITFELTILGGAFAAFFGVWLLNGLPRPYHPVFNAPGFALASRDHFFLCVFASDPLFNPEATPPFLRSLGALSVEVFDA